METRELDAVALGEDIRRARKARQLTQKALADAVGVSRKFVIDLEAGHEGAALGLALRILHFLGMSLVADGLPLTGRDFRPSLESTLARGDYSFALRLLGDYAQESLNQGHPALSREPQIDDIGYKTTIGAITRWIASKTQSPIPEWAAALEASVHPIFPAERIHPVGDLMKDLIRQDTPVELAALNVWMRERDLTTT